MPKNVAHPIPWASAALELIAKSSFTFMTDNFPTFSAGNRFDDL